MKQRIKYIDILRAIAIILVIIGHIPNPNLNTSIHKCIYAFHIPLFFFISGMTASFTNYAKINLKEKIIKRFFRTYLPFLLWATIGALANLSLYAIACIIYGSHNSLMEVNNSSLWFLPTLFLSSIAMDLILFLFSRKKSLSNKKLLLIPLFFLIALAIPQDFSTENPGIPFGLNILPMALFFMLLGYFFQAYKTKISKIVPKLLRPIICILCLFLLIFFGLNNHGTNYVLMAENRYGNLLCFFIAAISGIVASTIISLFIAKKLKHASKFLALVGNNTLVIFAFQRYSSSTLHQLLSLITTGPIPNYILIPTYGIIVTITCLIVSLFVKRFLPALAGIFPLRSNNSPNHPVQYSA